MIYCTHCSSYSRTLYVKNQGRFASSDNWIVALDWDDDEECYLAPPGKERLLKPYLALYCDGPEYHPRIVRRGWLLTSHGLFRNQRQAMEHAL